MWAEILNRHFSPTSTWNNAEHRWLSEKQNRNCREAPHRTGQMATIKKPSSNKCWRGRGKKGALLCCCACVLSHVLLSARPHGLQPARLLCPRDSPGQNTRAGCHFLLQGIFPTQGSNPHLLHWQEGSLPLSHLGKMVERQTAVIRSISLLLPGKK